MRITDRMTTACFPPGRNTIEYTLILPENCRGLALWLHGYQERSAQILQHRLKDELQQPLLEQLAEEHHLAVAIPDVPDTYYMDQPWTDCFTETFLTAEFLPALRAKYPLPDSPAHTAVAGISMGGFGAMLLGSRHPELFGRIASVSGAFIIYDLLIGNPEVIGSSPNAITHFQNLFGDIPSLDGDINRNPEAAALYALSERTLPPLFLACGKDDTLLYSRNRSLLIRLENAHADVTWFEADGAHSWGCFETILPDLFAWLAIE